MFIYFYGMYSGMFTPASFHDPNSLASIDLALLFCPKESAGRAGHETNSLIDVFFWDSED